MKRRQEPARICDARCECCGTRYGDEYTDDGDVVTCPHCGATSGLDYVLTLRERELDDLYEDAAHARAEAWREAAYERRRGVG